MWIFGFVILTLVVIQPLFRRRERKEGKFDYCEIIYPVVLYLYVGMGLRGLLLCSKLQPAPYRELYDVLQAEPLMPLYVFLASALGVACLYAGYFFPRNHRMAVAAARLRIFAGPHSPRATYALCTLFALAAAGTTFFVWRSYEWLGTPSLTPKALAQRTATGGLYVLTGWSRLAFIGVLVSTGLIARRGGITAWLVWLLNIAAVVFWFLVSSGKESLFLLVFGFLIVRNYMEKRVGARSLLVAAIAILYLYPVLVSYRYFGTEAFLRPLPEYSNGSELLMQRSHQFDVALLIMDRVKGPEDLKYGSTFTELAYFYIPRAIWPQKPMSFGYRFGEEYIPGEFRIGHSGGETPSLVGELFLNFHLVGVGLGMFFFGMFLKSIYVFLRAGNLSPLKAGTYALFALDAVEVVEGPIASHLTTFVFDLAPLVFMGVVAARFGRIAIARAGRSTRHRTFAGQQSNTSVHTIPEDLGFTGV